MLRVVTTPEGAEVFKADETLIGITPTSTLRAPIGTEVSYVVRKKGYRPLEITATVTEEAVKDPMLIFGELLNFSPPMIGEKWEDHLGLKYLPNSEEHITSDFINKAIWRRFLESSKRSESSVEYITISENGRPSEVVLAPQPEIIAFVDWLRGGGIRNGFLTPDHEVLGVPEHAFQDPALSERARREELKPFQILVREYTYAGVQLTTAPPGADIYMNGLAVGATNGTLLIPKVRPGPVELLIILEGYKPLTLNARVNAGENLPLNAALEKSAGVVFGKPWTNGIGMKFAPLGPSLMASIWQTRVKDYQIFTESTDHPPPALPGFDQNPEHPVIYVSRDDAKAFCEWLTERERKEERIAQSHHYRLPTDVEWSRMAGLDFELGDGPGQRDANKPPIYPWGSKWPPPNGFANYADLSAADLPGITAERVIADYTDGFPRTAPVGSFSPSERGFHDISGNVHEWVADDISTTATGSLGVVRGGGWNTYIRENLLIGWRNPVPSGFRGPYYGFRIVLSKIEPNIDGGTNEFESTFPED